MSGFAVLSREIVMVGEEEYRLRVVRVGCLTDVFVRCGLVYGWLLERLWPRCVLEAGERMLAQMQG